MNCISCSICKRAYIKSRYSAAVADQKQWSVDYDQISVGAVDGRRFLRDRFS